MEKNKVVVRFKNGAVKKGTTGDFFPNKVMFHLRSVTGDMLEIHIEELKAVYFVKKFEGNKDRRDDYTDNIPGGGRKVQVKFSDGEVLTGYTQGYSPNRPGFFIVPGDTGNNNEHIYVVASATSGVIFI